MKLQHSMPVIALLLLAAPAVAVEPVEVFAPRLGAEVVFWHLEAGVDLDGVPFDTFFSIKNASWADALLRIEPLDADGLVPLAVAAHMLIAGKATWTASMGQLQGWAWDNPCPGVGIEPTDLSGAGAIVLRVTAVQDYEQPECPEPPEALSAGAIHGDSIFTSGSASVDGKAQGLSVRGLVVADEYQVRVLGNVDPPATGIFDGSSVAIHVGHPTTLQIRMIGEDGLPRQLNGADVRVVVVGAGTQIFDFDGTLGPESPFGWLEVMCTPIAPRTDCAVGLIVLAFAADFSAPFEMIALDFPPESRFQVE